MSIFHTSLPAKSYATSSPLPTKAKTSLPSVLHDAEARLPSSPRALPVPPLSDFAHFSLPSVPMQMRLRPFSSWAVTKMCSPQMQGVLAPGPGSFAFQTMFSSALHLAGKPFSFDMPSFFGPRHCGQFSADADIAPKASTKAARSRRIMDVSRTVGVNLAATRSLRSGGPAIVEIVSASERKSKNTSAVPNRTGQFLLLALQYKVYCPRSRAAGPPYDVGIAFFDAIQYGAGRCLWIFGNI